MKIGIVGWGVETQSAFNYFGNNHEYIICNEHADELLPRAENIEVSALKGERTMGDAGYSKDLSYLAPLPTCDLIIYTPVAWNNVSTYFKDDQTTLNKCKTSQHMFFELADQDRIIAVTGTKGKSTVVDATMSVLKHAGKKVYVGGNVGICPLDFLDEFNADRSSVCVLELSSYQLNNLEISPKVSVLLSITPEHIDWHGTFEDYVKAKANITLQQSSECILIYDKRNTTSSKIAEGSRARLIEYPSNTSPLRVDEENNVLLTTDGVVVTPLLKGIHNLYNLEVVSIVFSLFCNNSDALIEGIRTYKGLEHRLESVAEISGVTYINDSIACTPEASLAGIDSFKRPVILLTGGHDRGLELDEYCRELRKRNHIVKHILVFGEVSAKLSAKLTEFQVPHELVLLGMKELVRKAQSMAQDGDIVLLSPGFSSYDSYKKFHYRGDDFKNNVSSLANNVH